MSLQTYQWIKGEQIGQIRKSDGSTISEGNIEYLIFNDGSRCNTSLLGDYIMQIESDDPADHLILNDIAPTPMQRVQPTAPPVVQESKPAASITTLDASSLSLSPLETILHTSKKVKKKVTISIEVEVPPADLIKVVAASFDQGNEQVLEYLKKGWTTQEQINVQAQVAEFIMNSVFKSQKTMRGLNETI